jgi:hypothetical protein
LKLFRTPGILTKKKKEKKKERIELNFFSSQTPTKENKSVVVKTNNALRAT